MMDHAWTHHSDIIMSAMASNHRRLGWLLNRLFRRSSKKTSKLRVTGLCEGNHRWPVDSPHKGPVTRKFFSCDDVIMQLLPRSHPAPDLRWKLLNQLPLFRHYNDVTMSAMVSPITSLTMVYSTVIQAQIKENIIASDASLAFVRGIHRWPVNSPHKWPVTRNTFPFDDVIMVIDVLPISDHCQYTDYLLNITFILDRCNHIWLFFDDVFSQQGEKRRGS